MNRDILKEITDIIEGSFGKDIEFCKPKNYRASTKKDNTIQFTVNILSLDVLFSLMELDEVENVYFHASASPPSSHVDPQAFRFRVYVELDPSLELSEPASTCS